VDSTMAMMEALHEGVWIRGTPLWQQQEPVVAESFYMNY